MEEKKRVQNQNKLYLEKHKESKGDEKTKDLNAYFQDTHANAV